MVRVARARADVEGQVGKLAVCHAVTSEIDGAQPPAREDGGLGEAARVFGLVEPEQAISEAALGAEGLVKSPQERTMPHHELAVVVNVVRHGLVDLDEVLIAVLGARVVALGGPAKHALEGIDIVLLLGVGGIIPLDANTRIGAGGSSSKSAELGLGLGGIRLVAHELDDVCERDGVDGLGLEDLGVQLGGTGERVEDGQAGSRGTGHEGGEGGELGHCFCACRRLVPR